VPAADGVVQVGRVELRVGALDGPNRVTNSVFTKADICVFSAMIVWPRNRGRICWRWNVGGVILDRVGSVRRVFPSTANALVL